MVVFVALCASTISPELVKPNRNVISKFDLLIG
jgi:hypothetical protein